MFNKHHFPPCLGLHDKSKIIVLSINTLQWIRVHKTNGGVEGAHNFWYQHEHEYIG